MRKCGFPEIKRGKMWQKRVHTETCEGRIKIEIGRNIKQATTKLMLLWLLQKYEMKDVPPIWKGESSEFKTPTQRKNINGISRIANKTTR